jgi:hypothetical protein
MTERVWEDGKSERRSVIDWIGIQNLSRRESVQTSVRCNSRKRLHRRQVVWLNNPEGMHFSLRGELRPRRYYYDEVQQ